MTRKNATSVYFTGELENEVRERELPEVFISKTRTREDVMREIDCIRKTELYEHKEEDCSPLCKSKGCSNLRVIDSCWKVCMCHCMFAVPMEVDGYPLLNFPNVCTLEPKAGSVFCQEHHKLLEKHNIPTKKEDFLQFLGCTGNYCPREQSSGGYIEITLSVCPSVCEDTCPAHNFFMVRHWLTIFGT